MSFQSSGVVLTPRALSTPSIPAFILPRSPSVVWVTETVTSCVGCTGNLNAPTLEPQGVTTIDSIFQSITSPPISDDVEPSSNQTLSSQPPITTRVLTITQTVTVVTTPKSSTSFTSLSRTPSTSRTTWSAPAQMTDLSAFNISSFGGGKNNLAIVQGIPLSASAKALSPPFATATAASFDVMDNSTSWDNSTSILQLFYPANSINPGNRPVGGAQFYATPLEMADARNVTLQYSAFFPADFDWVLAGKLPGLYGGRSGCSGGDDALDCFSTRLMWRKDGIGELYLYAPKEKQTLQLCSHPQSLCDSAYGLSIGRGSFSFARGAWTKVQQSVALNTPGKQDGVFTLDVNGQRVIERNDMFYRDTPGKTRKEKKRPKKRPKLKQKPKPKRPPGDLGDLLRPLLGSLLGREVREGESDITAEMASIGAVANDDAVSVWDIQATQTVESRPDVTDMEAMIAVTGLPSSTSDALLSPDPQLVSLLKAEGAGKPVGFIGLFFSTFFGGHKPEYATPRDQYVWFKDFAISYSS